jgi:hypothetical protein
MSTATTGSANIEIGAPPLAVYQLVSGITRMGEWSPECYRCEWLDGATGATVGVQFRGHNRLGRIRWQRAAVVTAADPGREFAFAILNKNGRQDTLWSCRLSPLGEGTGMVESNEFLWCPVPSRLAELPIGALRGDRRLEPSGESGLVNSV